MKYLVISLFVGGLMFDYAFACQCVADVAPSERLADSDAVFVGKVTKVDTFQGQVSGATLEVQQAWKGTLTNSIHVLTLPSTDCNYEFVEDETYLVYAYGKNSLSVNACSGTKPVAYAYKDLKALGSATIVIENLGNVCLGDDKCHEQRLIDKDDKDLQNLILVSAIGVPVLGFAIGFVAWSKRKNL